MLFESIQCHIDSNIEKENTPQELLKILIFCSNIFHKFKTVLAAYFMINDWNNFLSIRSIILFTVSQFWCHFPVSPCLFMGRDIIKRNLSWHFLCLLCSRVMTYREHGAWVVKAHLQKETDGHIISVRYVIFVFWLFFFAVQICTITLLFLEEGFACVDFDTPQQC